MIHGYIVPIVNSNNTDIPHSLQVARTMPGYKGSQLISDTSKSNHGILLINADSTSGMDSIEDIAYLEKGQKVEQLLKTLDKLDITKLSPKKRAKLLDKLARIGQLSSQVEIGNTVRGLLKILEPSIISDYILDTKLPEQKNSITDNFNRASLGSGWSQTVGNAWATQGSATAVPQQVYTTTCTRRSETSFPNDQYAQVKTERTGTGDVASGAICVRMGSGGACYFYEIGSFSTIWYYNGSSHTYLSDSSTSISTDTLYTLKLQVTGSFLQSYFEGLSAAFTSNSSLSSGKPGMLCRTGDNNWTEFDDFECSDAVSAVRSSDTFFAFI